MERGSICGRGAALVAVCFFFTSTALAQTVGGAESGYTQRVIVAPDSETRQFVSGLAAVENEAGELVLAGSVQEATDEAPSTSSAFLARIDDGGVALDWTAYATGLADSPNAFLCLRRAPNRSLIAGGTAAGAGYALLRDVDGETLWSLMLEAEGIDRVVAIEPVAGGGFFVVGESDYRTDAPGAGQYVVMLVDGDGVPSAPARYGVSQQEAIIQVVEVLGGAFQVYSYADDGAGAPPELWVRGFGADGAFRWEKNLGANPDYPVAGVHLTLDLNVILVRPRLQNGVFDESCRLEYLDQEGNHYRTRDLILDIYGTHLAGALQFTSERFGIVTYDREAVHVAVCDYRNGLYRRHMIPVDQSLAANLGDGVSVVARPEIKAMTLRDNGNLVLAGSLITEPETFLDESGGAVELYTVEIGEETLHLDFSELIGRAAMDLLDHFETGDVSGDGTLRYYEAVLIHPSLTLEMFYVMDLDSNNTLSYGEVEQAAYGYYKYGPGGIAFCGTGEQRIGGDWALAFVMLAFLLYWGRRTGVRRRARQAGR